MHVLHIMCMKLFSSMTERLSLSASPIWVAALSPLEQELEKLASRKLRINAKETMKIAEKLYTQG